MARSLKVRLVASVVALAMVACDRPAAEPPVESVAAETAAATEPPVSYTGRWADELGALLMVPADDNSAIVIYPDAPDSVLLASGRIALLGTAGEAVAGNLVARPTDSLECGGAPVVRLNRDTLGAWAVGLVKEAAILRSDSIEALPARDSARVVASLARLASTITANEETRFNGLPFAVVRARGFTMGSTRIVAAHLVRKLPQEASPLEERTFVIAERPVAGDSLVLRFSQRSEGTEDTAEHFEVLFGATAGSATLLLLARDNVNGTIYQLLERTAQGAWRVRWSRTLRC